MDLNDDGFDLAEYAERQRQEEADPDFVYQPAEVKLLTPPKNPDEVEDEEEEDEEFYKPLNS
jgi:hypothetical protein